MDGKRLSVLRSSALLIVSSLWASSASPIQAVSDGSSDMVSVESQNWSTWQEYAVYLVSQQLCEAARSDGEDICLSVIADMADKSAMTQNPHYPVSALEISGWHDGSLLSKVGLRSDRLPTGTRSTATERYNDFPQATYADRPELGLRAAPAIADSAVEDAIPGSLLVTILALVGIVAVARRDIPGKHAVDSADLGAEATSVTYLRQSTSHYGKLHQ